MSTIRIPDGNPGPIGLIPALTLLEREQRRSPALPAPDPGTFHAGAGLSGVELWDQPTGRHGRPGLRRPGEMDGICSRAYSRAQSANYIKSHDSGKRCLKKTMWWCNLATFSASL